MKLLVTCFYSFILICFVSAGYSQQNQVLQEVTFIVKGLVIESDTRKPITNVNVELVGSSYTTTDVFGKFSVKAKKGDELIIKHKDFETVYYTIQNNESITVEVEPAVKEDSPVIKYSKRSGKEFRSLLNASKKYLKKDAKKSIQYVSEALTENITKAENAEAYALLGDIYIYWKQFDLAVSNYQISLQHEEINTTKLKLSKAYVFNKNYQEAIALFNSLNKKELSNYQLIEVYEGLGDIYALTKAYDLAINNYNEGLEVAQKYQIALKVTDLNSKIADAYSSKGAIMKAKEFYERSLKLATQQNKRRAIEEKIKVADFQNNINDYSTEIELRQEALTDINAIEDDQALDNESQLTPQKQNYKIGKAYASQNNYDKAISFLEESIEEAGKKEDLSVQKDATRKLSEVYRASGDFNKALSAYQGYVEIVDKLYRKKEQEISQAVRFSKDLTSKQNRIISLESDRKLSESKYQLTTEQAKRQKLIIYALFGGVLLLVLTAFLMFKYIKQQRLANNLLALKSLRSQMNPHFIFNALNSVNSFIASNDERTANKYLTDFSKLMRAVLENSEEDFIPLEKEIELLKLYTKLEHFRFQEKFDYSINIDDTVAVNDFVIPPMLLQPYIENAVWHGLRYKKTKGFLKIDISWVSDGELKISIIDNGIGREKSKALKTENQQKQNSKGMGNIKKRVAILNEMYKDKVDVVISDLQKEDDLGTKVVVILKKD